MSRPLLLAVLAVALGATTSGCDRISKAKAHAVGSERTVVDEEQAVCEAVPGANIIRGTHGDDELVGTDGPDCILGRGGDDVIRGLGGNDVIFGGAGDDVLIGGAGSDVLDGGSGNDELRGDPREDLLVGGPGANSVPASDTRYSLVRFGY